MSRHDTQIPPQLVLDRVAAGDRPKAIARELGVSHTYVRFRLSQGVKALGCRTPEQAAAVHVAERIRAALPAELRAVVDAVLGR